MGEFFDDVERARLCDLPVSRNAALRPASAIRSWPPWSPRACFASLVLRRHHWVSRAEAGLLLTAFLITLPLVL